MMLSPEEAVRCRAHIVEALTRRVNQEEGRRKEALGEFIGVTMPMVTVDECRRLAELIPPLMPRLAAKWIGMFADRLFETVAPEHIRDLCAPGPQAEATLCLVYVMFLESERMEEQIARDLAGLSAEAAPGSAGEEEAAAALAAAWLRERLRRVSREDCPGGAS